MKTAGSASLPIIERILVEKTILEGIPWHLVSADEPTCPSARDQTVFTTTTLPKESEIIMQPCAAIRVLLAACLSTFAFLLVIIVNLSAAEESPSQFVALHPDNPHYFLWRSKPTILVTSGEHYGAVLNLDFDYVPYFDELQKHGLNHTRTFSGAYHPSVWPTICAPAWKLR